MGTPLSRYRPELEARLRRGRPVLCGAPFDGMFPENEQLRERPQRRPRFFFLMLHCVNFPALAALQQHENRFQQYSFGARRQPGAKRKSQELKQLVFTGTNPGALKAFVYRPGKLRPGAPLVVVLHGCKQSAGIYNTGSGTTPSPRRSTAASAPSA